MAIVVSRVADVTSRVGEHLGWSDWHVVTQADVDHFAAATGNTAPIHTDPEFAATTPYGSTIAFGIQVLAMATMLLGDIWELRATNGVDVGANRVRHLAPVLTGRSVRLGATIVAAEEVPPTDAGGTPGVERPRRSTPEETAHAPSTSGGGVRTTLGLTFEVEGSERPACVAEIVFVYWF
jgi:acyl dehydratase